MAKAVCQKMPPTYGCYIEPFLGSGAVFFEALPQKAILGDSNQQLIETFRTVRDYPTEVYSKLLSLHKKHCPTLYYEQRAYRPTNAINRAARFIYLNRTCWNGLYRVNLKNKFNVPIGTKSSVVFPDDDFEAIALVLKKVELIAGDYEVLIDRACAGDLVYVDPPYTVRHNLNGFLKYNQKIFSWDDQLRLHAALNRARNRGSNILVSNADHESVRDLYSDFSDGITITRSSVLAGDASARGSTSELLVVHHG